MAETRSTREDFDRALVFAKRAVEYWKRALLAFVIGVAIAVPYTFTRPRQYRSETVILYQETIRSADIGGGDNDTSARRVGARLREVLLSRASLEPIIKDLQLYMKNKDPNDRRALIDAVDEMRKHISFKAREGDTFEIAFNGSTPEETQEVTKRLGNCIIEEASRRRSEQTKALKEFLTAESDRNNTDLREKEADLARFVSQHPILAARLQGQLQPGATATPGGLAPPPPNTGDPMLNGLEARAARIERQLAKASQGVPTPPPKPPTFQPPPDSAELVAARRDLADKLARYTDKHPDVVAARARLKAAEDQQAATNAAAAEAFAAAQASARAAQVDEPPPKNAADEAALKKELNDLRAQIVLRRNQLASVKGDAAAAPPPPPVPGEAPGSEVALEVEFRRLQRLVAEGRERQSTLDAKLFKASITASSAMDDRNIQVSVLDPAYLPSRPISSSRTNLLAGLLAASIALGIAVALISVKLDDRIHDRLDLERLDILPIIGVVPRAELPPASAPEKRT